MTRLIYVCTDVAMCDIVHAVKTIHGLQYLEYFSELRVIPNSQNTVFRASLIFKKRFPDDISYIYSHS